MKYSITVLLLFLSQFCYSQILVKLELVYNKEVGHAAEMFYIIDSIEKTSIAVSQIQKVNEKNLLSSFGLPLGETGFYNPECVGKDTLNLVYNDFSSKNPTQKFSINGSVFNLKLSLVKVSTEYCVYNLHYNHWGSYDVNFRQAAVLTSQPKVIKFAKEEIKRIKALKKELGNLFKKGAS